MSNFEDFKILFPGEADSEERSHIENEIEEQPFLIDLNVSGDPKTQKYYDSLTTSNSDKSSNPSTIKLKPPITRKRKKNPCTKMKKNLVKNYLPITCNAFTTKFVDRDSDVMKIFDRLKNEFAFRSSIQESVLEKEIFDYVNQSVYGKKDELSRKNSDSVTRQYKIRSKRDVLKIFHPNEEDKDLLKLIKKFLIEMISEYFRSPFFENWVKAEYKPKYEQNRLFFLNKCNIETIIKVYEEPTKRRRFE